MRYFSFLCLILAIPALQGCSGERGTVVVVPTELKVNVFSETAQLASKLGFVNTSVSRTSIVYERSDKTTQGVMRLVLFPESDLAKVWIGKEDGEKMSPDEQSAQAAILALLATCQGSIQRDR